MLVGGNAVNLYAYRRTTFDVHLLVRENDAQRWLTFFEQRGYRVFHRTDNFIRMHFSTDPTKALPVDLMLADDETFRKIRAEGRRYDVGAGLELAIPSPLHLIAMKLHALKSQVPVVSRPGSQRHAPNSSPTSADKQTHNHPGLPDLPQFDSLPATAGLNNVEAFRLSIQHALALLPTILATADSFTAVASHPERFSLR
ncbi:MAG TPA: hypothetical protein VFO30_03855 [Chthoniobacterales bacterium]|nr:hypothetical protein [Chthoniobacterales bacterium]